ncbi:lipoprotein NlpI [Methyloligella halotolerans]|uniref:Lipoprotein NlpI n=1 Tax=Methyloligella halotolerans TaxID=1177755 RepID=A0A1E2RYI0_9HYPH|nr:tetratricopeptide repeat protein [Methyloligella halotolerans]ODA67271.1 lipoprotein NlpI [Methyloligella halotolerans]
MPKPSTETKRHAMLELAERPILRWSLLSLLIVFLAAPAAYSEVGAENGETAAKGTLLGNYLSGRVARNEHDIDTAAEYYAKALDEDPDNVVLLEQAFLLEVANGDWNRAVTLGNRLIDTDPTHRIARFLLGLNAAKEGNYDEAEKDFASARQGPIADLASTLSRAWVEQARGNTDKALSTLDGLSSASWAQFYQRYHRALIADVAGRPKVAERAYAEAFASSPGTIRVAEAYARHLAKNGKRDKAITILKTNMEAAAKHPITEGLLERIEAGETPPLVAENTNEGLAEVYYGIGDALAGEGGLDLGLVFLQFGIYMKPDLDLAYVALAEAYDNAEKYDLELRAFDQVSKDSPLWLNVQIQKAFALNGLERVDEAQATLENLIKAYPDDIRPLDALGNILRSHERYKEALPYYDKAIALIDEPQEQHWSIFYSRGVCHERLKEWPKAEKDLKQALDLKPEESLVLNYLGYTWVDQKTNLKTAMDYIRKAVKLKPDDGYYVDSLGWAYYRLGNLDAAVKQLERAVELEPNDPIINDHLGDVYWRVGRKLEAKYQWQQALELKPEEADAKKIRQKLADGLEDQPKTKAAERAKPDDAPTAQ